MMSQVPFRSARGCLTCKKRRKKCDEAKPVCLRCATGDFLCLGYGAQAAPSTDYYPGVETVEAVSGLSHSSPYLNPNSGRTSGLDSVSEVPILSFPLDIVGDGDCGSSVTLQSGSERSKSVPRSIPPDPVAIANLVPLVIQQWTRISGWVFQPFPIKEGIIFRVNDSEITRWVMFVGAKIYQAIVDGYVQRDYMGWIDRLHRVIVGSPASQELAVRGLRSRLSGLRELSTYAFMISGNASGYALFKKGTPYFLQLASTFPHVWAPNSAIFISHALYCKQYEIRVFVLADTVTSLAFGIPPLLHYDTTPQLVEPMEGSRLLEWVYGCPADIILLLANINAWRAARWAESTLDLAVPLNTEEWRGVEMLLNSWTPTVEQVDESFNLVKRLAVQESWKQAVFIYLYMGMCGASSEDARVQGCVKQVVQLAGTVEEGAKLEPHLFLPCLIASTAARHESHRALLRKKLRASRNEHIWILRGIDFVPVLDHLWHGVGSGGQPVTWDDYVRSRLAVLPIDT